MLLSSHMSQYPLVFPRPYTAAPHSLQIGKAMLIFSTNPNPKYFKCSWKAEKKSRIFVQKLTDFFVSQGQK